MFRAESAWRVCFVGAPTHGHRRFPRYPHDPDDPHLHGCSPSCVRYGSSIVPGRHPDVDNVLAAWAEPFMIMESVQTGNRRDRQNRLLSPEPVRPYVRVSPIPHLRFGSVAGQAVLPIVVLGQTVRVTFVGARDYP